MYAELVKDPLIVAVFSTLIGVLLSQLESHLYASWAHSRKRDYCDNTMNGEEALMSPPYYLYLVRRRNLYLKATPAA